MLKWMAFANAFASTWKAFCIPLASWAPMLEAYCPIACVSPACSWLETLWAMRSLTCVVSCLTTPCRYGARLFLT